MMAVWRTAPAPLFTDDDLNFLVGLSQQAAIAIENARLFAEVKEARKSPTPPMSPRARSSRR